MPYCKYYKEKEQVSHDRGQTWADVPGTYRKGELYEYDSSDCSPFPVGNKFVCSYYDSPITISKPCDSTSAISSSEVQSLKFSTFTVGDCVTTINDSAFSGYKGLNVINFSNSVTSIGKSSFQYCSGIASLDLPDNLITIGDYSFAGCSGLTCNLNIPSGVTSIGDGAFSRCGSGLTGNITIPDSVTYLGQGAFLNCSGLTSANIGSGVTKLYAFEGCRGLTSCTIANGVGEIGVLAFQNCSNLRSIVIPDSVTKIGSWAFNLCTSLSSATIGNGVTTIGAKAFSGCTSLTGATIGSGVTSIDVDAFAYSNGLTRIKINAATPPTLGSGVFNVTNNCPIIVPCGSVNAYKTAWSTYAGRITCSEAPVSRQANLTLNDSTVVGPWCDSTGILKIDETGIDKTKIVSAEILDCVTTIKNSAFEYCSGLTSVTIPSSVTTIENWAFGRCTGLSGITIPSSVTNIGYSAFQGCSSLTSITIPDSVTNIGWDAFKYCRSLTSITINATTPPTNGDSAFNYTNDCPIYVPCQSINAYKSAWSAYASRIQCINGERWVEVTGGYECSGTTKMTQEKKQTTNDGGETWTDVTPLETRAALPIIELNSIDCGAAAKFTLTLNNSSTVSKGCDSSSSVTQSEVSTQYSNTVVSATIGSCVKELSTSAFNGCTLLTSVSLPNNLTSISNLAFYNCGGLTGITIPDSVTSIGKRAFSHCSGLTSCTIGSGVTTFGEGVFENCSGLTSVTIRNGATTIGTYAFEKCSGLTSITIPDSVTTIGDRAFGYCISLVSVGPKGSGASVEIPSGVTSIIGSQFGGTFYDCRNLTTVVLSDSVTSIGWCAFESCTSLTSCTIGSGVTEIGYESFRYCSSLSSMTINAATPPTLWNNAFSNTPIANGTGIIYVPSTSVNVYKSASVWSNYANRIQAIP